MGVLLKICCIFSEHLFLGTPLVGGFCKELFLNTRITLVSLQFKINACATTSQFLRNLLKKQKKKSVNQKQIRHLKVQICLQKISNFFCSSINNFFRFTNFPSCHKLADIKPPHEKGKKVLKIAGLKSFYPLYPKCSREACLIKCLHFLTFCF